MKAGAYYPDGIDDPTFTHVYGGDQLGNVWRLDMSQTMAAFPTVTVGSPSVKLLATLKDSAGRIQPITARPAGTHVGTQRIYYVGTGRYLGNSDLSDPGAASGIAWQQSIYGIRDQLDSPTFTPQANFRNGNVVVQTLTNATGGRTISKFPVDWTSQDGFYIDLNPGNTSPGERIFLDVRLILGTLIFTSNVPSAGGACVPGGNSFQYGLDYLTGGYVGNNSAVLAGINVGAFLVGAAIEQTADNQIKALNKTITGQNVTTPVPLGTGFQGQRFGYRER
jgi:type IV pilus assembly protein PilY1